MCCNATDLPLAAGQDVEIGLEQTLKERRAPSIAIEDDRHPALTDELSHLGKQLRSIFTIPALAEAVTTKTGGRPGR